MAVDECLLEAVGQFGAPVLRFYNWSEPAATFGYFQKYLEIERLTPLRPLVRRPTGGGLVPHEADWTYSLAFPVGHPWYALTARESYQRVHAWIQAAFARIGCATEMAARARHERPGQCFAGGAEQFDLLWEGGKIAGAAQRRTKQGLLIQGSIQRLPGMPARAAWQQACRAVAVEQWGVKWAELSWDSSLENRVRELVEKKYGRAEYNQRR
jgi:lipoate-protein ligase A